MSLRHYRLRL